MADTNLSDFIWSAADHPRGDYQQTTQFHPLAAETQRAMPES